MLPSPKVLPWAIIYWAYSPWGYQVIQPTAIIEGHLLFNIMALQRPSLHLFL